MKYEKNVRIQNCSFQKDLQILSHTVSDKRYFSFQFQKIRLKFKNSIFRQIMWDIKKRLDGKLFA